MKLHEENLNYEKTIRELLSRRDPFGYYIIIAVNNDEAKNLIKKYESSGKLLTEEMNNMIIVRGRSRKIMETLARILLFKKLIILDRAS